jgi:hypothetical protein
VHESLEKDRHRKFTCETLDKLKVFNVLEKESSNAAYREKARKATIL